MNLNPGQKAPYRRWTVNTWTCGLVPDGGCMCRSWQLHLCQWPESGPSCIRQVRELQFCKSRLGRVQL